jgi:hypothetical protein
MAGKFVDPPSKAQATQQQPALQRTQVMPSVPYSPPTTQIYMQQPMQQPQDIAPPPAQAKELPPEHAPAENSALAEAKKNPFGLDELIMRRKIL